MAMLIYPETTDEGFETPFREFLKYKHSFFQYLKNPKANQEFIFRCRKDPVFAIQSCFSIQNPKDYIEKGCRRLAFRLYTYQARFIRHLHRCYMGKEDCIVKKSRETGFSWLTTAYSVWRWLFFKEENIILISMKQDALYKKNNPATLFGKVEYLIKDLNGKLCQVTYKDQTGAQISNPINGSIVRGAGGQSTARSQRASIIFADEMAFWENPEAILADLTSVAATICYGSTLNQPGDAFDLKCQLLKHNLFEFNWRDDPRKARPGWKEEQIAKIGEDAFRTEYNMEYNEDSRSPLVRYDWFIAAKEFSKERKSYEKGDFHAGFDIAEGGGNYCALCIRNEGEIIHLEKWIEGDLRESVRRVINRCNEFKCDTVNYDATAMGRAVRYALEQVEDDFEESPFFNAISMTMGVPERWYGGRAAKDQFVNGRTYWSMVYRDGILKTFNYVKFVHETVSKEELDDEGMIWFSNALDKTLLQELHNESNGVELISNMMGKLQVESKKQMANRGMKSPDLLDACVLAFIGYDMGSSAYG